jgi:hypothetical protein
MNPKEITSSLMMGVEKSDIGFYPYRQARVAHPIFEVSREVLADIEDELALAYGNTKDNHTTYVINAKDGINVPNIAIQFTDFKVIIGIGVDLESW